MAGLAALGISLEIVGVLLASVEYFGPERFDSAQRRFREFLRLKRTPEQWATENRPGWNDGLLDVLASLVAIAAGFSLLLVASAPIFLLFDSGALNARIDALVSWYYSLLPSFIWLPMIVGGIILSAIFRGGRAQSRYRATLGRLGAAMFIAGALPLLVVIVPILFLVVKGTNRAYRGLHGFVERTRGGYDRLIEKKGKPLLVVGLILVVVGLSFQFLDAMP